MIFKNIDLDGNNVLKNKVPLLIKEKDWIRLFGNVKNKNIQYIKEELTELVKKEEELEKAATILEKEKLRSMKMILGISHTVNNENKTENIGLLDEYKRKIEDINEELEDITFQLETIPQDIRELNFNLLKATVNYGYKELNNKEKKRESVTRELASLRERLKELINEKYDYEEWIDATYSFLHGMLGSERMEKLDEEILD